MLPDNQLKKDLVNCLIKHITENKKEKILNIVQSRTNYITVVLENIHELYDINAVIRSCECLGIQSFHVVENNKKYKTKSSVSVGSSKWVDITRYSNKNNLDICINSLKENGYKIVATSPSKRYKPINELDLNNKLALFFGDEENGLSDEVFQKADEIVTIPMYGFTESFNLSVSVGIAVYNIIKRLQKSNLNWKLSEDEVLDLELKWIKKIIKKAKILEKDFLEERNLLIT